MSAGNPKEKIQKKLLIKDNDLKISNEPRHSRPMGMSFEDYLKRGPLPLGAKKKLVEMLENYLRIYQKNITTTRYSTGGFAIVNLVGAFLSAIVIIGAVVEAQERGGYSGLEYTQIIGGGISALLALYGFSTKTYKVWILSPDKFSRNIQEFKILAEELFGRNGPDYDLMLDNRIIRVLGKLSAVTDIIPVSDDTLFLSSRMDGISAEIRETISSEFSKSRSETISDDEESIYSKESFSKIFDKLASKGEEYKFSICIIEEKKNSHKLQIELINKDGIADTDKIIKNKLKNLFKKLKPFWLEKSMKADANFSTFKMVFTKAEDSSGFKDLIEEFDIIQKTQRHISFKKISEEGQQEHEEPGQNSNDFSCIVS